MDAYEAWQSDLPAGEFADKFEGAVLALRDTGIESEPTVKDLVRECINEFEEAVQNRGKIRGITSGFPDLDKITSGFRAGQMTVIAARPGQGKSSIAMNIAEHLAVENRIPVGVFSLEMTARELIYRTICSRARVDSSAATIGELTARDLPRITRATAEISRSPRETLGGARKRRGLA